MAHRRFTVLLVVFVVLVYDNHGYVAHRRVKNQKPGIRSYSDANKNSDINVCALEQKTTINLFCYCDDSAIHTASSADCWVFNDGEPRDSSIWQEFRSQSNITKLTFNVRGSSAQTLSFVPTEALAQLPELRTLEIVYAGIRTIHSHAFANLSHLQDLALGRNNILRLSRESIAFMEDVRVVTLGDNAIDGISNDVFANLPALRKLYMNNNNISYIAEGAFEQLRKLEELDVSVNRLTGSLSRYVFLGLISLKRLDMRANHIERVGPDAFAELVSLEELVLEDNTIRTIDGRGFSGLNNLQRLTLAENRLTVLDDRILHHLEKLRFIDIRYNNLKTLTFSTIEPLLDRLRNISFYFYLEGNQFECDCDLLWMNRLAAETINEQVKRVLSEAECTMNSTAADGDDGSVEQQFGSGKQRKAFENGLDDGVPGVGVGGYGEQAGGTGSTGADGGGSGGGTGTSDGADAVLMRSADESQLTKVSALDEDTCPGKEPPVVDGAPDAAQNSDRVLWESTKTSGSAAAATAALFRTPSPWSSVSPLLLPALVFALRSRCC
ncbi:connectin-like [Sipha flava]|uniref:Connectin n=1 Tax=Sipha flava TaxID=143950 RepID=A0A2S2QJH7_9HEMI|nr:connectin-like [Sipha flava]XP_025417972.1 connectin-like [Sipha flava]